MVGCEFQLFIDSSLKSATTESGKCQVPAWGQGQQTCVPCRGSVLGGWARLPSGSMVSAPWVRASESWVQTSLWRQQPGSLEAQVAGLGLARCIRGDDVKAVDSLCPPVSGCLPCLFVTLPPALLPWASTWHHKQKHRPEISADRVCGLGQIA